MELRKRQSSKKAPVAALTLAGAGAIAMVKRDKILGAMSRGSGSNGNANGSSGAGGDGEMPPVTRLPKPGIG